MSLRLGGWLFRHRGWLPAPLILALWLFAEPSLPCILTGLVLPLGGEALRLWAASYIGLRSRTRGSGIGALVRDGPYRYSRNPLYIGNLMQYTGVALLSGRALGLLFPALMVLQYQLIVRWEEHQLAEDPLKSQETGAYQRAVPRWLGRGSADWSPSTGQGLRAGLRSERSTLVALLLVMLAFALRLSLVSGIGQPL